MIIYGLIASMVTGHVISIGLLENIYIYIYIYIYVHLNLSQAYTLPALHKKSYKLNTIEDKTVPSCMTPVFF